MAAEEKREYAIDLLDDVPENKWDNVIGFLLGITEIPRNEDSFYSEEHMRALKRKIDDIESGRSVLKEHSLIEV